MIISARMNLYIHITLEPRKTCRANTGYGLRCLKYKIAKLWNELDTKLKEKTSPTQFKSLLKLVLMIKLYSDY